MTVRNALDTIRFYTALDPYYYTVDNRPLVDLRDNQNSVAEALDAAYDASKAEALAISMVMRGYSKEDYGVAQLEYPGDLTLQVNRAILNQADSIGIQATPVTLSPFTVTAGVGEESSFLVQGRLITAVNTMPHYDNTNTFMGDAYTLKSIEYQVKKGSDNVAGTSFAGTPQEDPGWIPLIKVVIPNGQTSIGPADVFYGDADARLYDEGAVFGGGGDDNEFSLSIDTRIATQDQQTFNGLTVNAEYAMVYVQGNFQSNITVNSPNSITLGAPLPAGTIVDFVVTAGGYAQGGRVRRVRRIASDGQQTFSGLSINARTCSVFVDGSYQDIFTVVDNQTITLPAPVVQGTIVVFEERTAGVADLGIVVPPGGDTGHALVKLSPSDYDYEWAEVGGGGSSGPTLPVGGEAGDILIKQSVTDGDAIWDNLESVFGPSVFSVETQQAVAETSVFNIGTDASTVLVFVNGAFTSSTATGPTEVTLASPAFENDVVTFVQIGRGSIDPVTIAKDQDVNTLLNGQWITISANTLVSAASLGDNTIIAGEVDGTIYSSTNRGYTWASNSGPAGLTQLNQLGSGGGTLFAVGDANIVYYSNSNGTTWTPSNPVSGALDLNAMTFDTTTARAIVAGGSGVVAHSIDFATYTVTILEAGGVNFTNALSDGSTTVITTTDLIRYSTDGGDNWLVPTINGGPITGIVDVTHGNGKWIIATETSIWESLTGAVWDELVVTLPSVPVSASYIDGIYLVFLDGGAIKYSIDQAATWHDAVATGGPVSDFVFTEAGVALFVGGPESQKRVQKVVRGV